MPILGFVLLQLMDVLTTLVFLHRGVAEANPLIRLLFAGAGDPVVALLAAKVFSVALAGYAWSSGRQGILWKINVVFAACVGWNLVAIFTSHFA